LDEIETLRGIVPICAYCKKIRDDDGYWNQVEKYVSKHTGAKFSHGICPACFEEVMKKLSQNNNGCHLRSQFRISIIDGKGLL